MREGAHTMSKPNPTDRKYTNEHEWALDNHDGTITAGITDYAQELLTDIVFVELPEIGKKVRQFERLAVLESVKSVSDVYTPACGEVVAINQALADQPEIINKDAFGEGWIAKIKMADAAELNKLMDAAAYDLFIKEETQ
jgi:glycine cleavage system H protein